MADKAPLDSQTSAAAAVAPTFPDKIRVHALAKLLGVTSKQVLAQVAELGSELRSAQSSVDRELAERVHAAFAPAEAAPVEVPVAEEPAVEAPAADEAPVKAPRSRSRSRSKAKAPKTEEPAVEVPKTEEPVAEAPVVEAQQGLFTNVDAPHAHVPAAGDAAPVFQAPLFIQPDAEPAPRRRRARREAAAPDENAPIEVTTGFTAPAVAEVEHVQTPDVAPEVETSDAGSQAVVESAESDEDDAQSRRRRRGRRGRGRGRGEQSGDEQSTTTEPDETAVAEDAHPEAGESESERTDHEPAESGDETAEGADDSESDESDEAGADGASRRRRRRRRRKGSGDAAEAGSEDDGVATVVHEREPRAKARVKDEVQGISGSTRLEAKRQRRRDGRDAGRRRPPILTESEFLARREAVDRVMVVREKTAGPNQGLTQVAVLEDGVLVEHFVTSSASASMVGNVYLGRVQNVLPSMEAAFIDIGRGRNGVLYAGEVNWEAAGLGGNSRKIEQALRPGDQVLVQVSKDPVGHKGARLTTQISLAGRFLVYVPGGSSTGISRKLPDTERKRLKEILREIVPPEAGVIIRTASEGVSAEELARDVTRLQSQWAEIEKQAAEADKGKGSGPKALYEEPDMLVKVVRDLFNEDFAKIVIEGEKSWSTVENYIKTVAPDLLPRVEKYEGNGGPDVFEAKRIDEQLAKALDRKVWLPSGGTLVIDRTEAMTVVDVNTGKFTGAGGNLEETVTRNNLEAAEEVVRQMRLRDIGGMIVVDFIDMVLESNRDLVLRRLTEALGRDRTRHQVSEVTSLGLVQMTRKKLGTGLVEAFSTTCEHCHGRGIIVHADPVEEKSSGDDGSRSGAAKSGESGGRKRRGRGDKATQSDAPAARNGQDAHDGTESHDAHDVDATVKRAHPVALAMAAHHDDHTHEQDQAAAQAVEAEVVVADAPVVEVETVEVAAPEVETPAVEAPVVEVPAVEVVVETAEADKAEAAEAPTRGRRRSRRSSRSAAGRSAESTPEAEAAPVERAPEPVVEPVVVEQIVVEPVVTAPVVVEPVAEPVAAAPVASEADAKAPTRRPRRRASARPAGPPTDA
ncbi:translation initiation factor IF-2 N-terminal domain-containing protein [Rhodococcus kronopolitis]|uniref:Translation initiation factor IF-2 N-terminal domain-containing protein n=1 Tax=Rhodococcus kronopolitis TaxID=1460226 RepID=A0ABV9FPK1_9NOCA